MKELERILREHAIRYPIMEPTDAVKLIYQNEFGGGHLIRDEISCRNYLRREYDAVIKNNDLLRWEDIGNGIVRVNLAALKEADLEWLGTAFIRSAEEHRGNLDAFKVKLTLLRVLTEKGIFSFSSEELETYLTAYEAAGFPAVSHSQRYRDCCSPAYRIILKSFCK